MKLLCKLFSFVFILGACNSNTIPKKPKNLIPKDQMVAILIDTYLAKSAKNITNNNGDININYHAVIYDKYGVDSLRFHHSLQYYTADIKQHEELLKKVESTIEKKIKTIQKELKKNQKSKAARQSE